MKIKKTGILLLLLILLSLSSVFLYRRKKKQEDELKQLNYRAVDLLLSNGITENHQKYINNALQLAHNLGTAYPYYDPRSWSENDLEVFNIVVPLSAQDLTIINILYQQLYTVKNSDLFLDLRKLLDSNLYSQLNL